MTTARTLSCRKATVSLIFAIALIPMLMMVGLAIDFGFYTEAQAQLDLAADSSALHAVRIALQVYENETQANSQTSVADALNKGQTAGTAWFTAQLGNVPQSQYAITPTVQLSFNSGTNQITAQVNYAGVILTHFAKLFPANWPEYPNWGIAGAATAVISTLTYSEFDFLVDNSSSMLIASGPADIQALEALTPCSTQATAIQSVPGSAQPLFGAYSWFYDPSGAYDNYSTQSPPDAPGTLIPFGYTTFGYTATAGPTQGQRELINRVIPSGVMQDGECDPRFATNAVTGGYGNECFYVPGQTTANPATTLNPPLNPAGFCTPTASGVLGGGVVQRFNAQNQLVATPGVPQAPCAFACHTDPGNNDYYGLARANNIKLRFDVIQEALTSTTAQPLGVIPTLENYVQNAGNLDPVTVGVYYFNTNFTTSVSPTPNTNSLAALQAAESAELAVQPAVVQDNADTNTPSALTNMAGIYSKAGKVGSGSLPSAPKKYLFLITDGMEDYTDPVAGRIQGALSSVSLQQCQAIKDLGVKIFVLYTTYYPLPNPFYLQYDRQYAEPTGPNSLIYQKLAACASPGTTSNPTILEASDASDIGIALNKLVESALSAPGRLSN
jgi:Flp pilus assembly protein TadG